MDLSKFNLQNRPVAFCISARPSSISGSWFILPSEVRAGQGSRKEASAALGSSHDGVESLVEHNKLCEATKARPGASLRVYVNRLSNVQHCVQKLGVTKHTV